MRSRPGYSFERMVKCAPFWIACVATGVAAFAEPCRAESPVRPDVPLGSADFYPSSERPVGWRGDRTGAFPGATPVTNWSSKTGENIVWKCLMPAPSWGQPIVVGERVFTTADPNLLLCVSALDGKILWKKQVDHTTLMPAEDAKKAKDELTYFDSLFPLYVDGCRMMGKLQTLAKTKGIDEGALKRALIKAADALPDKKDFDRSALDQALADAELRPMVESLTKLRKEYAFTFTDPHRGDNWSAIDSEDNHTPIPSGKALNARMDALVRAYDIWPWPRQNWYADTSMTFATPCSDGQFVYVAFPNNQVATYDLQGTCKWMIWDHPPDTQKEDGAFHTRFVASPILVGDNLVVNHNSELRVYDKKTGKKIWGLWDPYMKARDKHDKNKGSRPYRPTPEGTSPVHVRLPFEGKFLDYIADGGDDLFRLSDGAIVCSSMPRLEKGQSPVAVGDLLVWKTGGDASPYTVGVCRLKVIAPDKVECERLWKATTNGKGECTPITSNGVIYDGQGAWEILTGKEQPTAHMGYSWNSPILAGEWIIGASGTRTGAANKEGRGLENVLVDDIDATDPEWPRKVYCGQGGTFGHSSWYAAGNRLFFRTAGYLWCVGDPQQPFVPPKSCPAEARAR